MTGEFEYSPAADAVFAHHYRAEAVTLRGRLAGATIAWTSEKLTVGQLRAQLDSVYGALAELVRSHDGPRDAAYGQRMPMAWDVARALTTNPGVAVAGASPPPLNDWKRQVRTLGDHLEVAVPMRMHELRYLDPDELLERAHRVPDVVAYAGNTLEYHGVGGAGDIPSSKETLNALVEGIAACVLLLNVDTGDSFEAFGVTFTRDNAVFGLLGGNA